MARNPDITDDDLGYRTALDGLLALDGAVLIVGIRTPRNVAKYAAIHERKKRFLRDTVDGRDEKADMARIQNEAIEGRPIAAVVEFGDDLVVATRGRVLALGLYDTGALHDSIARKVTRKARKVRK